MEKQKIDVRRKGNRVQVFLCDICVFDIVEVIASTTMQEHMHLRMIAEEKSGKAWNGWFTDENQFVKVQLKLENNGEGISIGIAAECTDLLLVQGHHFLPRQAVKLQFKCISDVEGLCAIYMEDDYWTLPYFGKDMSKLPMHTQAAMVCKEGWHVCYMSKCMDNAFTELCGVDEIIELRCFDENDGSKELQGEALFIGMAKAPQEAIKACYQGIRPRERRKYPEILEYFGWCSWNAFYHDVNAEGLEQKIKEFRDKGLPVGWILIDDGWSETEEEKLLSFEEDRGKFPEGLKGFIEKAKRDYGISKVGVWQAFTGYWGGIKKDSKVYCAQKENLTETKTGVVLPSGEKALFFWNTWHAYLKQQGVDFVKVDVQGGLRKLSAGACDIMQKNTAAQEALDASVEEYFAGSIINCMGMGNQNAHKRPDSALMRSSGDFFPDMENGFMRHARQNALNSLFFGPLYYTDWDMWWTKHQTAMQSAVMRSISGGPIYISDKVGDTQPQFIWPLIEADGRILRCDGPAIPTADCIYRNCEENFLKLWNTCGANGVLGIFCFDDKGREVQITKQDVPLKDECVGYCYFAKKFFRASKGITLPLGKDDVEIINFYPVREGKVLLGDLTKYISSASREKRAVAIEELGIME